MVKLAVVIPCYNVSSSIIDVVKSIGPEISKIYVIDDCCPQKSGDLVNINVKDDRIKVLYNSVNLGIGGATKKGISEAFKDNKIDICLKIDGDGQMDTDNIIKFVSKFKKNYLYVKGNRFHPHKKFFKMPLLRIIGNFFLSIITKITTGQYNTAVGTYSGSAVSTSNGNTSLGYRAGDLVTTGAYNTSIGYYADPAGAQSNGNFTLGDTNVATLRCNDTSISSLSDARDKTDVVDLPHGLAFINQTRPVQFKWESRDGNCKDGETNYGFIAQELLAIGDNEEHRLVYDSNPEKLEARYSNLIPMLTKAIQELSAKVEAQQSEIDALKNA